MVEFFFSADRTTQTDSNTTTITTSIPKGRSLVVCFFAFTSFVYFVHVALFLVHRRARVSDICIGARVLMLLPVVDGDVGGQSETKTHTHTHAHALFYYQPPPYPHPTTPGNGTGGRRSILRHAETAVNNGK